MSVDEAVGAVTAAARDALESYAAERDAEVAALTADRDRIQAEFDAHMATHEPAPDPEPAVKIGAAFKTGESLPAAVTGIDVYRFFFQPGDFTRAQTWAGQTNLVKAHDEYGCRTFSISLKPDSNSGVPFGQPDRIRAFLDTIPADVAAEDVLLTFYHEHDGNLRDGSLTLARYQQGSERLAAIAHERGHLYGPIHNGNVYSATRTPKWGLYADVWAANEADTGLYDFWGVDCYAPNYEDPSPRLDPIKAYADSLGLPVLIGEHGAPSDDPTRQAAYCTQAREWCLANTRWACYWSSQVSTSAANWRLSDAAARAWFGIQ